MAIPSKIGSINIERARLEHASYLFDKLRKSDEHECRIQGYTPWRALHEAVADQSGENFTLIVNGTPIAITGHAPVAEGSIDWADAGIAWLLGSNEIQKNKVSFYKTTKYLIEYYSRLYDFVTNDVPLSNETTLQWLTMLGCVFSLEPHITNGYEMCNFIYCQKKFYHVISGTEKPETS